MNIVILGLPGAGKGTQATRVSDEYGVPHVSMGDILRNNKGYVAADGRTVGDIIDGGNPVPVETTAELLAKRLNQPDCSEGWVLDGFPRWAEQAEAMDDIADLDVLIVLDVTEKEVIERLTNRRICADCGESYHLMFKPPEDPEHCDRCDGELYQREDDTPDAIKERVDWQESGLEEVMDYYKGRDVIEHVDGKQSIDAVWDDVKEVVSRYA